MKALLIIDMPETCYECDYCGYAAIESHEGDEYKYRSCALSKRYLNEIDESYKDSSCPLKPLPKKKDRIIFQGEIKSIDLINNIYIQGYNACIEEILGEQE